jgi:HK97 family phage portal protein
MSKVFASLIFRGNAYLRPLIYGADGSILAAHVLHPDEVSVAWDRNQLWPIYSWRDQTLEANRQIFHIAINQWPGHLKGVGPITAARLTYQGMMAEQNMARRLYEDDATPSGTLNVPQRLEKPEAEAVQEAWEASHGGRKRPAVLSGGVTFEQITINPVDAQFLESRNFSVQEVARMFGLPGVFLLVESGGTLTYTNPEMLFTLFLKMTLNPTYLERIQAVWSLMLPAGETARFDTSEILTPDIEARYRAYEVGLANQFLTLDEVRRDLQLPPIEPARRPTEVPV